jgi:lysophospholipase II
MNMGMPMPSWYDIVGLDERSNENCKGIQESRIKVVSILEAEHKSTGLPYSRMVLAGFSQGGALSLFTGLQLPKENKPAGVVVMSGYLAAAKQFHLTEGFQTVPILHCHGTMDPMVQFSMAEKTKAKITAMGATSYTLKSYPIQHTVSPDEVAEVKRFLEKVLPPDDTCKVKVKEPSEMSVKELKAAIRQANLSSKAVGFMEKTEFVKLLQDHRAGKL